MNLNDILEAEGKQLVIIYPGRFHPFHIGHGKVYKYLKQKYSNAKVFIATSGKVDGDRSPFTFDEKKKMMMLAGVDASAIVQTKSPYQSIEIMERFDKDTTVMVFAVSEKDMAEDPRFDFSNGLKLKKNGEPAYLQKWTNLNDAETFGTRGYIATTPTFPFEVLGQKINSASQIRNMISKSDDTKLTQLLQDLYSVTDVPQDVIELFKNKIGNTETMNENWDEHSFSEYLKENVIEDNIMKDNILQALTEGKSPHKKGTKKYKAHMAAMHAESIEEEFDRKVKETKIGIAADIKDYVDDHKAHFDAYPMDVEVNGKVYDFDEYWEILDKVFPDAYDKQSANEGRGEYHNEQHEKLEYIHHVIQETGEDGHNDELMIQQALEYVDDIKVRDEEDEMKLSYVSKALSASVDEDRYFDQNMADQALEYVEDIREQHFNADGSTKSESVNESSNHDIKLLKAVARQMEEDAHKGDYTAIEELLQDVTEEEMKAFLSDHRSSNEWPEESVNEADVDLKPIEGSFDWVNSMSDGTLKTLKHAMNNDWDMLDGIKDLADFKRTIDIFFTNEETPVPEDIAKIFNKLLARDEKNIAKFNEFIRRAFIDAGEELEELETMYETTDHEVSMARKDVSRLAKYSSELEQMLSNVSEEEGLQGWVQAKITKAADYISSVKHYMEGDVSEVNENWKDVTPAGYGPDDYDEKDVAPEDHGGDLKKMQDTYKYNEDRNNHSENILMLAQAFGDRGEIKAVEGLLKIIKRQGYTTPEQSEMMYKAIHKKYYKQLFPETETEGNKFSGELEKAKIDGKKSFDVDGKTYKVKEALSKLIDKQKI